MRREELFLRDILESADRIIARVAGRNLASISEDEDAQDIILRRLTVIGEAMNKVPEDFRARYPEVPWRRAISLRNRVTHDYFGIDWTVLWKTVTEDIPMLRRQVAAIIEREFPPGK
jgi:uncharacterized protein with HEPN domain